MNEELANTIRVRNAIEADTEELTRILNTIIEIGGTTAFQETLSVEQFSHHFLTANECILCLVAVVNNEELYGFQSLRHKPGLEQGWVDIATFARSIPKMAGVGTSLFQATKAQAKQLGYTNINASIREDNLPGMRFYSKLGFTEYTRKKNVPLKDGTPVDRVQTVYSLTTR